MLDYSDKTYKISFEALMKFILSFMTNDSSITMTQQSSIYNQLIMITVKSGIHSGGCFYDFKDRESYHMTQNWATVLDSILEEKINESVSSFSEEAYNAEKGELTKENWSSCSFEMMSD